MTKPVLKPGIDKNGQRNVRASPAVEPATVGPLSERVDAKSLVPERKTAPAPPKGDHHAPANAADRTFVNGITDDITDPEGVGAILHVEDHATGLSAESFIGSTSDEMARRDAWAVLNKLLDSVARANARATKP